MFKFHALCKDLKITHLSYADNLLILIAANLLSVHMVKEGLEEFKATVCLAVNPARLRFFCSIVPQDLKLKILET